MKQRLYGHFYGTISLLAFLLLSASVYAQDAAKGETLFTNNCASCHSTGANKMIGPGLAGIDTRRSEKWIIDWVHNPAGMIESGDADAVKLYEEYKPTMMTAFGSLSEADIKDILAHIKQANAAPAAGATAAAAAGAAPAAAAADTASSGFFNIVLIALLAVMVLVLLALLGILSVLNRLATADPNAPEGSRLPFFERLKQNAAKLGNNPPFRTGALLLFLLLAGKATMDGLYGIGVHQGYAPKQPIAFSHKLHAGEFKIDCGYCHTGVYKGKQSGIPSVNICMNCHNTIQTGSPEIKKLYQAAATDKPIEWVRVHNLPDLAYFNHAQHTNVGGLQCQQCHGEVQTMEVIEQRTTLTMGWCIDCHRKTNVAAKDNKYYDKLLALHQQTGQKDLKVADIGGLECSKCHY